jgi:hypothetical protein
MVTLNVLGQKVGLRANPWMQTPFGKKGYVFFNFTGRRAKLERHPAVAERWKLFASVRPEANAACTAYSGVEKMACIARTMSAKLRK